MNPSLLPSFRLRDIDHAIVGLDVAWRYGEQLIDPHPGAPEHAQHEVVSCAALVCSLKYSINLLLFQVVSDILH